MKLKIEEYAIDLISELNTIIMIEKEGRNSKILEAHCWDLKEKLVERYIKGLWTDNLKENEIQLEFYAYIVSKIGIINHYLTKSKIDPTYHINPNFLKPQILKLKEESYE